MTVSLMLSRRCGLPWLRAVHACGTGSTGIATAAIKMIAGTAGMRACRSPEIMADAAHWILSQGVGTSGNFFIDDEVLRRGGATDKDIDKCVSCSSRGRALPLRCSPSSFDVCVRACVVCACGCVWVRACVGVIAQVRTHTWRALDA
jgi:hypothetical protein